VRLDELRDPALLSAQSRAQPCDAAIGHSGNAITPLFAAQAAADNLVRMMPPPRALWCLVLAAACASACASNAPRVRVLPPRPVSGPETAAPAGTAGVPAGAEYAPGTTIARTAETLLGSPYRDGGSLPDGFDCSGLVTYVFARHRIAVPRDVRRQSAAGAPVEPGEIAPGDLVFFTTTGSGPTHVGIAIGGGRFVHAPKSGDVVRVDSLSAAYWASRFVAARRVSVPRG
jgi:cell wall-associated NlpC family hydrolase